MTSTPDSKRLSYDVSDLVDQLRPYTPQNNRKAFREAQQIPFSSGTPAHIFSSPLPSSSNRGKPTAEEAAKALLAKDPFLNLQTPSPQNNDIQIDSNVHPRQQMINISAPSPFLDRPEQQDRVSASFHVRPPSAAMAFSPVLPRPVGDMLPPTEILPLTTPSATSYPLTSSHDYTRTPVSAAKPPRPPVPPLQNLNSPSEQPRETSPSTPFTSTIPLTYSAVKTPGAVALNFLGETPASARQANDPSSILEFFRARSARVTSPIFSTRKKLDCDDLGSPEVQVNPLAETFDEARAVPHGVSARVVVRMDFSQTYGFDRAEEVDLSSRANRVPVLYAVVVRTTDFNGNIHPEFAKLERDSDSPHTMLVDIVTEKVRFAAVDSSSDAEDAGNERALEATLTFWAAPDAFIQFGCAALLLTVTDTEGIEHETKVELHVVGTEPVLAVEAKDNLPVPERKETTVTFENPGTEARESITIWNQTFGGAPLLVNAVVADSASDAFTIRDENGYVSDCIPMMIPGGKSHTFTASFELLPNATLRGRYYGCVLLKLATLTPSRGRHTSSDIELHQFYDHVLNFEAHIPGVGPVDRLSTLEDPSTNNVEEMLYEHRYGNEDDIGTANVTAADATIKRLSLVVSPEAREPLPDGYAEKQYLVCDFNMHHPPCWVSEDREFVAPRNDDSLQSHCTEINEMDGEHRQTVDDLPEEVSDHTDAQPNIRGSGGSYGEWEKSLEDEDKFGMAGIDNAKLKRDHEAERTQDFQTDQVSGSTGDDKCECPQVDSQHLDHGKPISYDSHTDDYIEGNGNPDISNSAVLEGRDESEQAMGKALDPSIVFPIVHTAAYTETHDDVHRSPSQSRIENPEPSPSATIINETSHEVPSTAHESTLTPIKPLKHELVADKESPLSKTGDLDGEGAKMESTPRKKGTYLVDDPVNGVHRKNKRNLKGILETVGAAVDGMRFQQGFLKPYTKFDSNFNMSENMSAQGSMRASTSSAGSMATVQHQQRPAIRNLASRWGGKRTDDPRYRPKLRIPRKQLENGLSIAADSGSTKLTVCNGSSSTLRVDILAKAGTKLKSQILIQPQFLALRPEQKAVIRLTRLTSEESKAFVVLTCSTLDATQTPSRTYRLPVAIEAASNRVPTIQGFAVDRPTLTFYNPKSTARHCRVRVLNGTKRRVSYKVRTGENKTRSPYDPSPFKILSHPVGKVEPQKCFTIIVVFDAMGDVDYFHDKLLISVGRKTDFIPLFGYAGSAKIQFSRSEQGHLRAHNSGSRYGFLVLSGPEVESPDNVLIRTVIAPGDTQHFSLPYGSGTIVYTGDEIARTRLCRSHELFGDSENDDSGLFLGHFEGQEQAAKEEGLFWDKENKHTLHYAGRLMDSNTRRFMFDPNSGNTVPFDDRNGDTEMTWHASMDGSKFVHIENYDAKHELAFTAFGAEPNAGAIPPLGDAILAAFADNVQVYARGQSRDLHCNS